MRYLLTTICFCWLLKSPIAAQQTTYAIQDSAYINAVETAFKALKQGDCTICLAQYKRAFTISQKSAMSTLRAAVCAYQCQQNEQAVAYLNQAASLDFWGSEDMWANRRDYPEFDPVRTSPLAINFQHAIDQRKRAEGRNPDLERELKAIFDSDQKPRLLLDSLGRQHGYNSAQTKPLDDELHRADSLNLVKVEHILDQFGYPGKKLVGDQQSITAWLVIQHAPLEVQEKYFSLLQKAADAGEFPKANMALLIDRVRIRKGQKQLYGSQVHIGTDGKAQGFEPIEDEKNVNKRRLEMGLPPLEDYARHWGFAYTVPAR